MVLPLFLGYDAYILFYGFTYQMVSDYSRRDASANRTEKLKIINSLAEYYVKQGLKIHISDEKDGIGYGVPPARAKNEVLDAVIKALDGAIPEGYIRQNIYGEYKQKQTKEDYASYVPTYKGTPEEAVERYVKSSSSPELAELVIKDFKEKIRTEALEDPAFIEEATIKTRGGEEFIDKLKTDIRKEVEQEIKDEVTFKHDSIEILEKPELPRRKLKIGGTMCQIIPDELDSNAEGKDFSHITLYPQCLCNNCEHKKDCMGII